MVRAVMTDVVMVHAVIADAVMVCAVMADVDALLVGQVVIGVWEVEYI